MIGNKPLLIVDIEVYSEYGEHVWAQDKYLVHGYDDVLWTDDIDAAIAFLKESLTKAEEEIAT